MPLRVIGEPAPATPPTASLSRNVLPLLVVVAGAIADPTDMIAPPSPVLPGPPGPPSPPTDRLWTKVESRTVSVPVLRTPPPKASTAMTAPGRPTTTFSDTTALVRVRVPAFKMPPPRRSPCPWVTVRSSMLTAAPLPMLKTRLASEPLTASLFAPGPSIRTLSVIPNSPLVRATVPRRPWAKVMTSAPGLVLAAVTAARSEPAPLSASVRTVKVLGTVRSSKCSTPSRVDEARFASLFVVPVGAMRERADRSQDDRRITETPREGWSAVLSTRHRSRRADRAPGRCRAGGCPSSRLGPTGCFVCFSDGLLSADVSPV